MTNNNKFDCNIFLNIFDTENLVKTVIICLYNSVLFMLHLKSSARYYESSEIYFAEQSLYKYIYITIHAQGRLHFYFVAWLSARHCPIIDIPLIGVIWVSFRLYYVHREKKQNSYAEASNYYFILKIIDACMTSLFVRSCYRQYVMFIQSPYLHMVRETLLPVSSVILYH